VNAILVDHLHVGANADVLVKNRPFNPSACPNAEWHSTLREKLLTFGIGLIRNRHPSPGVMEDGTLLDRQAQTQHAVVVSHRCRRHPSLSTERVNRDSRTWLGGS